MNTNYLRRRGVMSSPHIESSSGSIVSFSSDYKAKIKDLTVQIEPVQDLHGYANPWPAGGGVNKFAIGDAVGVPVSTGAAYGLTIDINATNETVRIHGTPTWTTSNTAKSFRIISTRSGSYYGDAPVDHDYSGMTVYTFLVSKSSNISSVSGISSVNSDGTIGINMTNTDTAAIDVTVRIAIVASGTTISSWSPYSNICPITGWTGVDVYRTGVNVWDEEWEVGGIAGGTGQPYNADDRIRSKNYCSCVPNTTYYGHIGASGVALIVWWYDINNNFISGEDFTNKTRTSPSNATYFKLTTYGGSYTSYLNDISVNYPSTDTSYHSYSGTTYPISWTSQGTVYGGTLDVTSGVLTVTHAVLTKNTATMNNSETFPGWKASGIKDIIGSGVNAERTNQKLNVGTCYGANTTGANDILYLPKTGSQSYSKTETEWIALALDVQIYAELATPQVIQLTPTEVTTLLGENNVFADCGDVEVEYWKWNPKSEVII